MTRNIGSMEKIVRVILGITILAFGLLYNSWLGLIGLIPIITASISYCPLWSLFGISTSKKSEPGNY